ncbi:MAG: M20 family peptidase, partial [Firmicutes bacterium]|nr:M20 family peptidase [Bacillota bacterium]
MTYEERKALALAEIEAHHGEAIAINDALADEPEVSGQEYKSSARIVEYLRGQGWEVEYPFAGYDTAFKAVVAGGNNHKRKIAILTEYDALEIGHACGHCVSAATSVLAGVSLAKLA